VAGLGLARLGEPGFGGRLGSVAEEATGTSHGAGKGRTVSADRSHELAEEVLEGGYPTKRESLFPGAKNRLFRFCGPTPLLEG
jgi:hypothetical protein